MKVKRSVASVLMMAALAAPAPMAGAFDQESAPDANASAAAHAQRIVGSWRVDVAQSVTGLAPFQALHTFGADGTFSETTDLLPTLGEGPGHGAWKFRDGKYHLTFELFVFDPDKKPAGIIRVRCALDLVHRNEFAGDCAVDFIDPTGAEINDIDSSPVSGKRIKVIPR